MGQTLLDAIQHEYLLFNMLIKHLYIKFLQFLVRGIKVGREVIGNQRFEDIFPD